MKKIQSILSLLIALVIITSCSKDDPTPVLSSLNSIDAFEIAFAGVDAKDVQTEKKGENIIISVPFKTNLTGLKPAIKVSAKATVSPASGTAVDFVDGVAKPYTVTAEDGAKKTYNVTINVRGEVGSGSKLNTYLFVRNYGGIFEIDNNLITYTYNEASKFVSQYSVKNNLTADKPALIYAFVYDAKNQITERKCESEKESSVYSYNDKGQIISSTDKKDGKLIYSYTYTYGAEGDLAKVVRVKNAEKEEDKKETVYTFKYKDGNNIEETVGKETITATFDTKNNPFKSMYPNAFAKIEAGINKVNKNNPITISTENEVKYTYNTESYPLTMSSSNKNLPVTTNKTFTYNK